MNKFLYIIDSSDYKKYITESGLHRFIPNNLLMKFQKKIKPRVICKYITNKGEDDIVGYGIGISLQSIADNKENYLNRLIKTIENLEIEEVESILFDDLSNFDNCDISRIEDTCDVKVLNGRDVLLKVAEDLIKRICYYRGKSINNQELLIISDDTDNAARITKNLSREVKFLNIKGNDENFIKALSNEVLMETGLAIHNVCNISKRIGKYDIIINMCEQPKLNIKGIKKRAIVLDFSYEKELSHNIRNGRRDILAISDCIFLNPHRIMSTNSEFSFNNEVKSHIYEGISDEISISDLKKIKINPKTYTIKQATELFSK